MAKLMVYKGSSSEEFSFDQELTIGRAPGNDVVIEDPYLSRNHARIFKNDQEWVFEDLKTPNGVEVNGRKVTRHVLRHRDSIQIGGNKMVFMDKSVQEEAGGQDPMFAPTLLGAPVDPEFMPTMVGVTPEQLKEMPAQAEGEEGAPDSASAPLLEGAFQAGAIQPVAPGRKERNPARLILALAVLAAAGGLAWLFLGSKQTEDRPLGVSEVAGKFEQGDYRAVLDLCGQLEGRQLSLAETERLKEFKTKAEGKLKVKEIEQLIFEKHQYTPAWEKAQAAMNAYVEDSDAFVKLAATAFAAHYILNTAKRHQEARKIYDTETLRKVVDDLTELSKKYESNKENLKKLPAVVTAHKAAMPLLEQLRRRVRDFVTARRCWREAQEARSAKQWKREVQALEELSTCAPDVAAKVASGQAANFLLDNARNFQTGAAAFAAGDYETTVARLKKINREDTHWAPAQQLIREAALNVKYQGGVRRYQAGQLPEALAYLKGGQGKKVQKLRQHILQTRERYAALLALKKKRAWGPLIARTGQFIQALDRKIDTHFMRMGTRLLEEARLKEKQFILAQLKDLFARKKLASMLLRLDTFLKNLDRKKYPDLYAQTVALQKQAQKIVLASSAQWVRESRALWARYQKNPINGKDRAGGDAYFEGYKRKVDLLKEMYYKADQARRLVDVLPAEDKKEITDLYGRVKDEITNQSEKLYTSVRKAYIEIGKYDLMLKAEEKILMFPEVPGNRWYVDLKAERAARKKK